MAGFPTEGTLVTIETSGDFRVDCEILEIHSCEIASAVGATASISFDEGGILSPDQLDEEELVSPDQVVITGSGTGTVVIRCSRPDPAIEPPSQSTPDCLVTYGGSIVAANGHNATFGGNARTSTDPDAAPQGEEQYVDHDVLTFHSLNVLRLVCRPDLRQARIFGEGEVNGHGPLRYRIDLTDNGEPGTSDRYRIRLDGGYDSGEQVLVGGNIELHGGSTDGGRKDSAVGGGLATDGTGFGFSAHSDPLGIDAHGHITTKITRAGVVVGEIHVRVTCLRANENRATLGGRIERSNAPGGGQVRGLEEGRGAVLFVEDNGEPSGDTTPDRLDFASTPRPPFRCPEFRINVNQLDEGNVVVHDETM